ncbi:MAG: hypothetical protein ING77_10640 [Rhodocyclaceae bacterium]|jgi:hypothetical protein|nr:hypothetical protein [Rhodocyclaceae bacterium]MCE2979452.1 hypothetical protein [Betaproteobacteria bacterium]MCA3076234.1 hypothetical protein [Rhodocyclaceae bacterium]MCA3099971.1 hypothetical protein [Rhodocyclaceae bacterium]MCA3100994.1 hypothetical protein [Rhodocyclaceae bacterium]
MQTRGHLDAAELDALLFDDTQGSGVTVESFHVQGCRACREALLELALMVGLFRGLPLQPDLDIVHELDAEEPEAPLAAAVDYQRVTGCVSPRDSLPRHPADDALHALLACALDERLRTPADFFVDVRHVSRCDQCLARTLRLSERFAPPAHLLSAILEATGKGPPRPEE